MKANINWPIINGNRLTRKQEGSNSRDSSVGIALGYAQKKLKFFFFFMKVIFWSYIIIYYCAWRKPEWERQLGRSRSRWEDNMRMNLREIGSEGLDWSHLSQVRDQWRALINMIMNFRVPWKAGNIFTSWVTIGFSRKTLLRWVI
jgi:hypothetical protein